MACTTLLTTAEVDIDAKDMDGETALDKARLTTKAVLEAWAAGTRSQAALQAAANKAYREEMGLDDDDDGGDPGDGFDDY